MPSLSPLFRAAAVFSLALASACASTPPPEPETPVVHASSQKQSTLLVAGSDDNGDNSNRDLKLAGGNEPSHAANQGTDCQKLSHTIRSEANKLAAALKSMSTSELARAAMEIDASSLTVRSIQVSDPQVVDYRDRQAEYFAKFAAQLRKLEKAQAANNMHEAQQVKTNVMQTVKENKELVLEMASYCQNR